MSFTLYNSSSKPLSRHFNIISEIIVDTTITIEDGIDKSFKIDENLAIELNWEL